MKIGNQLRLFLKYELKKYIHNLHFKDHQITDVNSGLKTIMLNCMAFTLFYWVGQKVPSGFLLRFYKTQTNFVANPIFTNPILGRMGTRWKASSFKDGWGWFSGSRKCENCRLLKSICSPESRQIVNIIIKWAYKNLCLSCNSNMEKKVLKLDMGVKS